ncbi:YitT family protein [Caloramator sp. E03]|uniref:YitT family protein n=1 Tax=Caloramator sp. E03 TaxID=2576307 RepID=UPI0011109457|nr:YitT family protein [Caloramator sp. E03]QCX34619.1 YitT family protein [Caloramator sp. E03]
MNIRKDILKRVIMVFIGGLITSIGLNAFIIPHKLLSGGVSGISIIIQYITGIPAGYLIFIFNIPIFLFGMKEVDRDFIIFSLIGMLSFSIFLVLTGNIDVYFRINDILLSAIYGGVINGIGMGLTFRNRASQGGTDIIAVAAKKKFGINISTVSFLINGLIVLAGAALNNIEAALYTLISMYIGYFIMDKVIEGFDRKKMIFIVTEKEKEVSEAIMKEIGRGITLIYGEGAYTGHSKKIIYCIVTATQLAKTKKMIEDIDEKCFMSIIDASEVHGKGFKRPAI